MRRRSKGLEVHARTTVAVIALTGLCLGLGVIYALPSVANAGWARVPHVEAVFGGADNQEMLGVASTPSGFVAVGWDGSFDAAAVWFSSDGITWERATHIEGMFGGSGTEIMFDVTAGPGNAVAVGYDDSGSNQDAAVWTGGGPIWKRVAHDPAVFGSSGHQAMRAVAAAGPGVVAVGHDNVGGDLDAAVWVSDYGSTWTRVPHVEAVFGGSNRQMMRGVTAGGPGVVAVGDDLDTGGAAVWTSVDGLSWTRVPHDEAVFGGTGTQDMHAVTAGGPGLVAVGGEIISGDTDAAVWTSVDGLTWTRVPHDEAVFGGPMNQRMLDVKVGGPGLIAVGYDNDGADRDAAVWTSVDGLTWTRVPHDEAIFGGVQTETMNSLAVSGTGQVVAAGTQWDSAAYDYDAAVWTYSTPAAPPPPPPTPTTPTPSVSDISAPLPSTAVSPTASPGSLPGPAPSDTSGWGGIQYALAGALGTLLLGGVAAWVWLRKKP